MTDLLNESAAPTTAQSFTAWTSTTQGSLTVYRRGGQLAVTGPKGASSPVVALDGPDDEELASSMVDLVARHGDGFVTGWNIIGDGRLARGTSDALLLVEFVPDEDEGYPGDDCTLTVAVTTTEDTVTVIASTSDRDVRVATMAQIEWPSPESFRAVRVHHGE